MKPGVSVNQGRRDEQVASRLTRGAAVRLLRPYKTVGNYFFLKAHMAKPRVIRPPRQEST